MTAIRILPPSVLAIALVSCAAPKNSYDTPVPPSSATASDTLPGTPPANPVYDTPAAYTESTTPPTGPTPGVAAEPGVTPAAEAAAPATAPANGAAIIHTVVKGDTLSGISKQYKVPAASIKQANRMTSDIVVLGRKMVIPPH